MRRSGAGTEKVASSLDVRHQTLSAHGLAAAQ
jgi:hypothetical protein